MHNIFRNRVFLYCCLLLAGSYLLTGCATVPSRIEGMPRYSLNGTSYLPLISVCEKMGVKWEYDTLTRQISLYKNNHTVKMAVGSSWIQIDGSPRRIEMPVRAYRGIVVIPQGLRTSLFSSLFEGPAAPARARRIKRIVLDAGHGGKDPGAIGRGGLREKDVNFDIVKRLKKRLESEGFEVILTRASDIFITLGERSRIANRSGADLFISIHSNANRSKYVNGFEVYYLTSTVDDSNRAYTTAMNTASSPMDGDIAVPSESLRATLWDLYFTQNRSDSIGLAKSITREANKYMGLKILGVKGAKFFVLKGARMPAVLVEVGFLSNSKEERLLRNGYYRQQIADSIAGGIMNYADSGYYRGGA
ncbi:MAG: N-acetylmuramoyl-L-alanine amidase [Candidatus Omnitrophica bacterium]|nr:N-acetylmuramoyl-L-alanine amidase [Candidatus Omnitrophota bacterium]